MQHKQKDILNTQLSAENSHRPDSGTEPLFKVKRIAKTPFSIVNKEGNYFLTVGNHMISPTYNTEDKIMQWLEENKWNAVTTLILLLIDKQQERKMTHEKNVEEYKESKE